MKRLTDREREVVLALAEGLSNKDVGCKLNISEGTVKAHLHNIYSKLGVKNRTALAALAHTEFCEREIATPCRIGPTSNGIGNYIERYR